MKKEAVSSSADEDSEIYENLVICKNQGFFILFISLLIVILIFAIFLKPVQAEDIGLGTPGLPQGLNPESLEKVQTGMEKLANEQERSQYLKQEWNKVLENNTYYLNYIKPVGDAYNKTRVYTDPFFRYTIGIAPTLSWLFVLTFVIWIVFVFYIWRGSELISFVSEPVKYIIAVCLVLLISAFQINKKIAEEIIKIVSAFDTTKQLIVISIIIIIIILLSIFSKTFRDLVKSSLEKKAKGEDILNREKTKSNLKALEEITRGLKE